MTDEQKKALEKEIAELEAKLQEYVSRANQEIGYLRGFIDAKKQQLAKDVTHG